MSLLCYAGDSFWRGIEWLGLEALMRGIPSRKLQLVYVHWSILLAFLILSNLAAGVLIRRSKELRCIAPPWAAVCVLMYCLIVGRFFFNRIGFTHAMLDWPWHRFVLPMLGSLALAVIPVWLLYGIGASDRGTTKVKTRVYLALIPVLHSLMAVMYLLNPHYVTE